MPISVWENKKCYASVVGSGWVGDKLHAHVVTVNLANSHIREALETSDHYQQQ